MKSKLSWGSLFGWLLPVIFLGIFYFFPLSKILGFSFHLTDDNNTPAWWLIFSDTDTWDIVWFTTWQAAISTLLTLALGLPGAYLFARFKFPGKTLLQALTTIPFILPTLVVAAAFNALLGPKGWVNLGLMSLFGLKIPPVQFMNSIGAILTAHVFYNTTIVLRTVSSFWSNLDPRLEQAARSLGATRLQTFFKVTLPLLGPVIAVASLLVFIFNFTSFGVILVLGGPQFRTLEVEIYTQTLSFLNLSAAASLSLIQLFFTVGLTAIYQVWSNRVTTPVSLRPGLITQKSLSSWKSKLVAFSVIFILTAFLITPLLALLLRSVTQIEPIAGSSFLNSYHFTLKFFTELNVNRRQTLFFASPWTSILISLSYALVTVGLSAFIGMLAAWTLTRKTNKATRFLDLVIMLPLGTSSVSLGLGFIVALSRPPIDLRTSIFLIPLAHTLVALPFVVRNLVPSLRAIRPDLHHAASLLGASPMDVIRFIDFPLASRALLVAGTFAFTISLGEFGATTMISRPEYPTIPVAIYRLLGQPGVLNYGQALALSSILMLVSMFGMIFIEKLRPRGLNEF